MKMSIDESLEWLISIKEHYEMDDNCQELAKALDLAIDIMNKYQKIKQIIKDDWIKGYQHSETLSRIKEVIEDGKID